MRAHVQVLRLVTMASNTPQSTRRVDWLEDTHALVHFDDDNSSSIVPIKRLDRNEELCDGEPCTVYWSDKKRYHGTLICSGSMAICATKQEELEETDESASEDLSKQLEEHEIEESEEVTKTKRQKKAEEEKSKGDEHLEESEVKNTERESTVKKALKKKSKDRKGKETTAKKRPLKPKSSTPSSKKSKDFEMWVGKASEGLWTNKSASSSGESSSEYEKSDKENIIKIDSEAPSPVHYISGIKDAGKYFEDICSNLETTKKEVDHISKEQDRMFHEIKNYLQDITNQVKTLAATNVAKHLAPFIVSASKPSLRDVEPLDVTTSPSVSSGDTSCIPTTSSDEIDADLSSSRVEVKTTLPYSKELLSLSEITPIYTKSRNRRNFAALLVQRLFDIQTRMRSNVAGRGKERLDPEIMKYIKAKCFEYFECPPSEIKNEWSKCVVSIDEKSRALKKLKCYKKETEAEN